MSRARVTCEPPLPPETAEAGGSRAEPKPPTSAATSAPQDQTTSRRRRWGGRGRTRRGRGPATARRQVRESTEVSESA